MGTRGWTAQEITQTVENGTAHAVTNKATGGAATEFINPANGKFVVIDNATRQVIQVSGTRLLSKPFGAMMSISDESLTPVLGLASGKTIGSEPAFTYPEVLDALASCTHHGVAVLGVELFKASPVGYRTEKISAYEVQLGEQPWHEFAVLNNSFAAEFVTQNRGGDDHFYLLTASTRQEYPSLTS